MMPPWILEGLQCMVGVDTIVDNVVGKAKTCPVRGGAYSSSSSSFAP